MKNPEELTKEGAQKYCMTYRIWVDSAMKEFENLIDSHSIEFFVTKKIYIGTNLPLPTIESSSLLQKLEVRRKTEEIVRLKLANYGWKIKEEAFGSSRVKYYLVKKS